MEHSRETIERAIAVSRQAGTPWLDNLAGEQQPITAKRSILRNVMHGLGFERTSSGLLGFAVMSPLV